MVIGWGGSGEARLVNYGPKVTQLVSFYAMSKLILFHDFHIVILRVYTFSTRAMRENLISLAFTQDLRELLFPPLPAPRYGFSPLLTANIFLTYSLPHPRHPVSLVSRVYKAYMSFKMVFSFLPLPTCPAFPPWTITTTSCLVLPSLFPSNYILVPTVTFQSEPRFVHFLILKTYVKTQNKMETQRTHDWLPLPTGLNPEA